ncbi:MAG: hypothetical protein WCG80_06060 [Spirochaetales bacterium]
MKKFSLAACVAALVGLLLVSCTTTNAPIADKPVTATPVVAKPVAKAALTWSASTFYLVGTINPEATRWDNGATATNLMTKLSDAVYERTVSLEAGTWNYQFADTTWTDKFVGTADLVPGGAAAGLKPVAMEGGNVVIATAGFYTFHFDLANQSVVVVPARYVVGAFGSAGGKGSWTTDAASVATYAGNGVYEKTYTVDAAAAALAGGLSFQFTGNGFAAGTTFTGAADVPSDGTDAALVPAGMANKNITGLAAGNYTLRIDTKGNKVQVAKAYYLVGHILSWEAGDWNTGTLPNLMVYDGGNNYSKVIKVIKGTSEKAPDFQFATSDWATAWTGAKALAVGTEGKLAAAHMANESVAIAATGSYLVTFNPVALTVKFTALP